MGKHKNEEHANRKMFLKSIWEQNARDPGSQDPAYSADLMVTVIETIKHSRDCDMTILTITFSSDPFTCRFARHFSTQAGVILR